MSWWGRLEKKVKEQSEAVTVLIITVNSILPDAKGNEYKVVNNIKSGGFGQVFLCERLTDGKHFALKTMLNAFPTEDEYNAFQNEINTAITIKDKNVISYEYMHDGSTFKEFPPYIIMEYAAQGTLRQLLDERMKQKELYSNEELTQMFLQLAYGMKCINDVLVHRDVKPENILINEGVLKISDFGLAKYVESTTRNITFKGFGTRQYSAPEAWTNGKNTLQMDIYSMGIIFYELATLQYPYIVEKDNYMEAHLYGAIENPTIHNSNLAPNIVSVINKMLQKPLGKRFSSWQDIIDILNADRTEKTHNQEIIKLVQAAVQIQNETDNAMQKKQAEDERKKKEREIYIKKIMSYFEREIIGGFKEFAEMYNSQYASGQMEVDTRDFNVGWGENSICIKMPFYQSFKITISVLQNEDFQEFVRYEYHGSVRIPVTKKTTYPMCKGKKILAWGKVEDNSKYGYNILLLENNDDEYGDWYILYNTNSGINKRPRQEPFAFSDTELAKEIRHIDSTYIYSSLVEEYNLGRFQELISKVQLRPM